MKAHIKKEIEKIAAHLFDKDMVSSAKELRLINEQIEEYLFTWKKNVLVLE